MPDLRPDLVGDLPGSSRTEGLGSGSKQESVIAGAERLGVPQELVILYWSYHIDTT